MEPLPLEIARAITVAIGVIRQARGSAAITSGTVLDQVAPRDRRDAETTYNPMTIPELEKLAPQFAWRKFFAAAGIPMTSPHGERMVIVAEKSAFPKLASVFAFTSSTVTPVASSVSTNPLSVTSITPSSVMI